MKLKAKILKLSAGRPIAILHKDFAEKSTIHVDDRIHIEKSGKKITAVVDLATGLLNEEEIIVSTEISSFMKLKNHDVVEITPAIRPRSLSFVYKKLECRILKKKEIKQIITDIVKNKLTEPEIAYFVSAIYKCGMSFRETVGMIQAIVETGKKLGLKGDIADKHSIGGIPGRTTPIIISIVASLGIKIPKTSSRAITTPAGTADAMETICRVDFSISEIKKILRKTNACLVWGGSLNIAPADDKIIQIERLLDLDPQPQLLASILAKKLAVNAKYVLIDIPYGKNAKVNKKQAQELSKKFKSLGKYFNLKLECSLKEVNEPLGNGIGPALEINDVISVLKRKDKCHKLEERSLELAGKLLELTGKVKKGKGLEKAKEILNSGLAFKKFNDIVKAQKGNLNKNLNKKAKFKSHIKAKKNSYITDIKTKNLNNLARIAGCPLDKLAGLYLYKHVGDKTKKGEKILTIYSDTETELKEAVKYYKSTRPIKFK